jgi:hypothetical protein
MAKPLKYNGVRQSLCRSVSHFGHRLFCTGGGVVLAGFVCCIVGYQTDRSRAMNF